MINIMRKPFLASLILACCLACVTAMAGDIDEKTAQLQQAFQQVVQEYQAEMQQIAKDAKVSADDLEKKAPKRPSAAEGAVGYTFEVTSVEHSLVLTVPDVRMVPVELSADIPQVVGNDRQDIVFHTPSIRMEERVVGRKPKFGRWGNITGWEDIKINVPVTFQQEHRVAVFVPKVSMARHSWRINFPETTTTERVFKVNLPSVNVKSIKKEGKKTEEKGEQLSQDIQQRIQKAKERFAANKAVKVTQPHAAIFETARSQVVKQKEAAIPQFDAGINALETALKQMRDGNVPASDPKYTELQKQKDGLVASKAAMIATFDTAINNINSQEQESLKKLMAAN